jgi:hypothetical protein
MMVTMSEKAARSYLAALADEGVAASVEVYHHTNAGDRISDVAILVIPLNGFGEHAEKLVSEFTDQLRREGYISPRRRVSVRAGRPVPTGNTGPNRK